MGADVRGAGTDTIKICGVEKLHGGTYAVIPDQIEAGTYMVAAAATGGEVLIKKSSQSIWSASATSCVKPERLFRSMKTLSL